MIKTLIICASIFTQLYAMDIAQIELLDAAQKREEHKNIPNLMTDISDIYKSIKNRIIKTKLVEFWKKQELDSYQTSNKSLLFSLLPRELRDELGYFIREKKEENLNSAIDFTEYRLDNYHFCSVLYTYTGNRIPITYRAQQFTQYVSGCDTLNFKVTEVIEPRLFIIKEAHPRFITPVHIFYFKDQRLQLVSRAHLHLVTSQSLNARKATLIKHALLDCQYCPNEPIEIHRNGYSKTTTIGRLSMEY